VLRVHDAHFFSVVPFAGNAPHGGQNLSKSNEKEEKLKSIWNFHIVTTGNQGIRDHNPVSTIWALVRIEVFHTGTVLDIAMF
jgi:hypothetical protein